jgi:hypothetical protein
LGVCGILWRWSACAQTAIVESLRNADYKNTTYQLDHLWAIQILLEIQYFYYSEYLVKYY